MPYWRLSSFYFFYFGLLGCISPYWGLFLDARGFTALEIGELMALFGLVRILAPNIWGAVGDRSGQRLKLLRIGAASCLVIFGAIFLVDGYWGLAVIMIGYGFFWAAVLPQFEVITMNFVKGKVEQYSNIRVWGSVGFVVFVWALGRVFDAVSVLTLPIFMMVILVCILLSSMSIQTEPSVEATTETNSNGFISLLKSRVVLGFLLATLLVQISHGAYYTFFSLYLQDAGYENSQIGMLWALGVVAEVTMFFGMTKVVKYISYKKLLVLSVALTGIRFSLTGYVADYLGLLILLQLTHAFTFGAMHSVSMHYIHSFFHGRHQGQGQALFSSVTYGAGGAIGAYLSGLLWYAYDASIMFLMAGVVSLVATFIAIICIPANKTSLPS